MSANVRPIVACLLLLALAACGEEGIGPGGASGPPHLDGEWLLVEGHGPDGPLPASSGAAVTLIVEGTKIGGRSACNLYDGTATISDGGFVTGPVAGTEMGCEPEVMRLERAYLEALAAVATFEVRDDSLTLAGPEIELRFERAPEVPTAALVDTKWRLRGLIEGRGPEGAVSSVSGDARLLLASDGTFRGSTGCREMRGEWAERGEHIVVTSLEMQGVCSDELAGQDEHVVEVIGDGFTAEIESRSLTIWGPGNRGLMYGAP